MGQFATFFLPDFPRKHALFQHLQQPNKNFPMQVGQYISKTIAPAISGENQIKKLTVEFL